MSYATSDRNAVKRPEVREKIRQSKLGNSSFIGVDEFVMVNCPSKENRFILKLFD